MRAPRSAHRESADSPTHRLKFKPPGPVSGEFMTTDAFIRIMVGPLGSGKTFAAITKILACLHNQTPDKNNVRRSRWCVARNSFPDLISATIPDFRSITDHLPFSKFTMGQVITWKAKYRRTDGTTVEAEVMFRSFDGMQDVKKARGMQLSGVFIDELAEFNKENFDMLIGRVKRYPSKSDVPDAKFHVLATSNACARDNWLAEIALGHKPDGWWVGIQPGGVVKKGNQWVENPNAENYKNLADGYYKGQLGNKKESWIRQNLANEFVHHSDGRPIHPDFSETMHTAELVPTYGMPIFLGMDWGRTPAAVICQQMPNGQWRVLDEIVLENAGSDKLGKAVRRMLNSKYSGFTVDTATGDPSGTAMTQARDETPFDLFNENSDLVAMPAHTNDPEIRFASLDNLLTTIIDGEPAIQINIDCTTLIKGLAGSYQFRRIQVTGEDRFRDQPDKGPESHVCEGLHYCLLGAGESEKLFNSSWDTMDDMSGPKASYFE